MLVDDPRNVLSELPVTNVGETQESANVTVLLAWKGASFHQVAARSWIPRWLWRWSMGQYGCLKIGYGQQTCHISGEMSISYVNHAWNFGLFCFSDHPNFQPTVGSDVRFQHDKDLVDCWASKFWPIQGTTCVWQVSGSDFRIKKTEGAFWWYHTSCSLM